ncbi:MAG TPA: hypothetical protein VL371_04725, partial [Gemmataceae bacterium]|nr:hypothetical protein [Gemmataceae bacterium]
MRLTRLEDRLAPAVATWDGGGADNHWTTAANWVGDAAPNPGDDLVFPAGSAVRRANVNDFPAGTAFHSVAIQGLRYQLNGNAIGLAAGLSADVQPSADPADVPVIDLPLTLTADQTFSGPQGQYTISGSIDVNGHALTVSGPARVTISGPMTGTGSLSLQSQTILSGNSTFSGPTVAQTFLTVTGTLPGPLTFASGLLSGTGTVGDVTVTGGQFSPGDSFTLPRGILKSGNLSVADTATTQFIVHDSTATGVAVTGTVRIGGELRFGTVTDVALRAGDQLTFINNDGTDPIVGTFSHLYVGGINPFLPIPEGALLNVFGVWTRFSYHGGDGNDFTATVVGNPAIAVGAGPGGVPVVNVFDVNNTLLASFFAYSSNFHGGVRVATGDVTGDGIADVITAPGPGGGPHVRVFDGVSFQVVREFMAYDPSFFGGVFIATGLTNDGHASIITGAGAGGGPHVKVFDGATGATRLSFMAYDPRFTGGVSVAGTEGYSLSHLDSHAGSIITGPGPGGPPDVRIFDGGTGALTGEFFAYDPAFRGGVNVAARGPVYSTQGSNVGSIVAAPASGGTEVRLFTSTGQLGQHFLAYDPRFGGGVTVGVQISDPYTLTFETGTGRGGVPLVNVWTVTSGGTTQRSFFAFD